jgi:hypothetical protein
MPAALPAMAISTWLDVANGPNLIAPFNFRAGLPKIPL